MIFLRKNTSLKNRQILIGTLACLLLNNIAEVLNGTEKMAFRGSRGTQDLQGSWPRGIACGNNATGFPWMVSIHMGIQGLLQGTRIWSTMYGPSPDRGDKRGPGSGTCENNAACYG